MMTQFEQLPKKISFDTNVITDILKFDIANEENYSIKINLPSNQSKKANDLNCLKYIIMCNIRGAFQFILSKNVLDEIVESKKEELIRYGFEFWDHSNIFLSKNKRVTDDLKSFKHKDAQVINEAINIGCNAFLTMDYKTIIKKRDNMQQIKILSPSELWKMLAPYANIFY